MVWATTNRSNNLAISYSRSKSALVIAIVLPTYQIKLLSLLLLSLLFLLLRSVVSQTVRFNLQSIFAVLDDLSLNQALRVVHLWPDRSILLRENSLSYPSTHYAYLTVTYSKHDVITSQTKLLSCKK